MEAKQSRSLETRKQILTAARKLFLHHGYDGTTTQMILKETALSKGALYHHFAGKDEILEAIYRDTSRTAIDKAAKAVDIEAPYLDQLKQSAHAWLKEIQKPMVGKILLEIGPQGLGSHRARAIEDGHSLAALKSALEHAVTAKETAISSPLVAAHLLNAILAEAAFLTRGANKQKSTQAAALIDSFIDGLNNG